MRHVLCMTAAALAAVGASSALPQSDENETFGLRVMTFNIRYGSADDGENAWPHRRDIVMRMIESTSPDVVGLQECLAFQADYLVGKLPHYRWLGVGREADGGGEHMAVLYRASAFSPIRTGNFWLSERPDEPGSRSWGAACSRMVTWVEFRHIATGTRSLWYNTHFDHVSEEARTASARMLADTIARSGGGMEVVVTGDFNAPAGFAEPWRILTGSGLRDAWLTAASRHGSAVTYNGFGPPDREGESRIDWILLSPRIEVRHCESVEYNEGGRYPSDHLPVVADLQLPRRGE